MKQNFYLNYNPHSRPITLVPNVTYTIQCLFIKIRTFKILNKQ